MSKWNVTTKPKKKIFFKKYELHDRKLEKNNEKIIKL